MLSHPAPNSIQQACTRLPLTLLWVWASLLPSVIGNQRSTGAIQEDRLNKPWRPLPTGRLSPLAAKKLMLVAYASAVLASTAWLGGLPQCLALMALARFYNDMGGGDRNFLVKNLVNACGYTAFASGAAVVAAGPEQLPLTNKAWWWFVFVAVVVLTTVHVQDLEDKIGDRARGRWTAPLVLGDGAARWSVAVPVLVHSFAGPCFWGMCWHNLAISVLGISVACRVLRSRSMKADKRTFQLWNVWMMSLFVLPATKSFCRCNEAGP